MGRKETDIAHKDPLNVEKLALMIRNSQSLPSVEEIEPFVNEMAANGDSLLITAIKNDSRESVILLLKAKADINQNNISGSSPLHIFFEHVLQRNNKESRNILKILLENKANPNAEDAKGKCVLQVNPYREEYNREIMFHPEFDWNYVNSITGDTLMHSSFGKIVNEIVITSKVHKLVDIKNVKGETPLHQYCSNARNIEMIKFLISHKADVNLLTNSGETPLSLSLNNFFLLSEILPIVEFLLKSGADVNQMVPMKTKSMSCFRFSSDGGQEPIFHQIVKIDNLNLVLLAIEYGGDIHLKDSKHSTLISKISSKNTYISSLIQSRSKTNKESSKICNMIRNKQISADTLLNNSESDLNGFDVSGDTPLITTIRHKQLDLVLPLLKAKADPKINNVLGYSPLHVFVSCGLSSNNLAVSTLELLLQYDADPNATDSNGICVLQSNAYQEKFIDLIMFHPKFNWNYIHPKTGNTLLHSTFGEIVNTLALESKHFSSVDICNFNGETSLHQYSFRRNVKMVKLLLSHGANVNFVSANSGETPLSLAISDSLLIMHDVTEVVKTLLQNKADVNQMVPCKRKSLFRLNNTSDGKEPIFHQIIKTENLNLVLLAVEHGGDIHLKDSKNATLISKISEKNKDIFNIIQSRSQTNIESAKLCNMIRNKDSNLLQSLPNFTISDLNGFDVSGDTPLIATIRHNETNIIEPLLNSKADPNKKNATGLSPLHIFFSFAHNNVLVLQLLLKFGADPNLEDSTCRIPLQLNPHYEKLVYEYLFSSNFNWNYVNSKTGDTLLHSSFGEIANTMALESKHFSSVDICNFSGETPLHQYSSRRNVKMIKLLLSHGANVNLLSKANESPLSLVINDFFMKHDGESCLRVLLESNADVNQLVKQKKKNLHHLRPETSGSEPIFHQIIKIGYLNWVTLSLSYNANPFSLLISNRAKHELITSSSDEIQKVLTHAIESRLEHVNLLKNAIEENNRNEVMKLLTRKGIDPNIPAPFSGNTSLHIAVLEDHFEITELLMIYSGDVSIQNSNGISPIELAIMKNCFYSLCAILSFSHIPLFLVNNCLHLVCGNVKGDEIKLKMKNLLENYISQQSGSKFYNDENQNFIVDQQEDILKKSDNKPISLDKEPLQLSKKGEMIVSDDEFIPELKPQLKSNSSFSLKSNNEIDDILNEFEIIHSSESNLNLPCDPDEWEHFNPNSLGRNQNKWPPKNLLNWKYIIRQPLLTGKSLPWIVDQNASKCYNCNSVFSFTKRKVRYINFFYFFRCN